MILIDGITAVLKVFSVFTMIFMMMMKVIVLIVMMMMMIIAVRIDDMLIMFW